MKTSAVIAVANVALVMLTAMYLLHFKSRSGDSTAAISTSAPVSTRHPASGRVSESRPIPDAATPAKDDGAAAGSASTTANAAASETPEEQQAKMREYLETQYRRIYEDLGVLAGLSADETDALLHVLVDQQMLMSKAVDGGSETDQMAKFTAWQQGRLEAVVAQIGVSRAAAFTKYEQSITARYEGDVMSHEFEQAQMPLTEPQRRSLIASAIERKAYIPMPEFPGNSPMAEIQKLTAQIEVRDQQMLDVARGILTAAQYSHYQQYQAKRHDVMEASLRRDPEAR